MFRFRLARWPWIVLPAMAMVLSACSGRPASESADRQALSPVVRDLLADTSGRDDPSADARSGLSAADVAAIKAEIERRGDFRAFPSLMLLRARNPESCATISGRVRAWVMCSALRHRLYLNEGGHLPESREHSVPGPAMKALLECDPALTLKLLYFELEDRHPAPFIGSADATLASGHQYRRCDFAAWAASLILGRAIEMPRALSERDGLIEKLRADLEQNGYRMKDWVSF